MRIPLLSSFLHPIGAPASSSSSMECCVPCAVCHEHGGSSSAPPCSCSTCRADMGALRTYAVEAVAFAGGTPYSPQRQLPDVISRTSYYYKVIRSLFVSMPRHLHPSVFSPFLDFL